MFSSLLIANRGEIARRINRTARRMGLETVAVYSDADAQAPFVREATHALRIGAAPARDSYLDIDAVMCAALRTGAEAIHPGYGFLSENAAFAQVCEAAGKVFIGPPADIIAAMGSKIEAKRRAQSVGVPVVPGFSDDDGTDETLIEAARGVGFPLLVKASAGGGGRGMRLVERADELAEAVGEARREAKAAFGNDGLLLERQVRAARHVEVQIAADAHGGVVHLFERDCSLQRKNQKIFEEAPAPHLPDAIRTALLADAVRLATAIGYRNLGTMEFLVDPASGQHFFLEMNTRLQVEHPVTELITGLDLVEWQLRIAAGEALPLGQHEITASGHAIEARLAAERPDAGFLPSTGRVLLWVPPAPALARSDSGIEIGSEVGVHYDSLLAKIIVHGRDREDARRKLASALNDTVLLGLETNRAFLNDLALEGAFAHGKATTDGLAAMFPDGWSRPAPEPSFAAGLAAAAFHAATRGVAVSPWTSLHGFRLLAASGRPAIQEFAVEIDGRVEVAFLRFQSGAIAFHVDDDWLEVDLQPGGSSFLLRVAGRCRKGHALVSGEHVHLRFGRAEYVARVRAAIAAHEGSARHGRHSDDVLAPMPGIIAEVRAQVGDRVAEGAPLVVLESMKLFQTLVSPRAGRVSGVHVSPGETVDASAALVSLEPRSIRDDPATS